MGAEQNSASRTWCDVRKELFTAEDVAASRTRVKGLQAVAELRPILDEIIAELKLIFGDSLEKVVLYGSYARGEQTEESDIDIMALVNMNREELAQYRYPVSVVASELDLKYDVLLSIKLQDRETFYRYVSILPFYKNVMREGICIGDT